MSQRAPNFDSSDAANYRSLKHLCQVKCQYREADAIDTTSNVQNKSTHFRTRAEMQVCSTSSLPHLIKTTLLLWRWFCTISALLLGLAWLELLLFPATASMRTNRLSSPCSPGRCGPGVLTCSAQDDKCFTLPQINKCSFQCYVKHGKNRRQKMTLCLC